MHPTREQFATWLDGYVTAWRSRDAQAIGDLFSSDARYSFRAGTEVAEGRAAIVRAWQAHDSDDQWEAAYAPLAIDGEICVARGWTRYFRVDGSLGHEYSNVFMCRFDADGRCAEFTEWWMRTYDAEREEGQP
jgi:hypothetical protein